MTAFFIGVFVGATFQFTVTMIALRNVTKETKQ